jgi:hypothetical protein
MWGAAAEIIKNLNKTRKIQNGSRAFMTEGQG